MGGDDIERRPETVRGHAPIAAEGSSYGPLPFLRAQFTRIILDRLGPAGGRRVLRAYISRGRQHGRTVTAGKIEDHAYISTRTRAKSARHPGGQGLGRGQSAGEKKRARAVINRRGVVRVIQRLGQEDLGQFVPAGGKLVLHLPLRGQAFDLQAVHFTRQN